MLDSLSQAMFHLPLLPPPHKEKMKGKKNNNLKSFFPLLKNPCVSSNSFIINLHQKLNLLPQPLKYLSWCFNLLHLLFFLPPLHCHFQTCISITNSQHKDFISWNINSVHNDEKLNLCYKMTASCCPLFILL